MHSYMFLADIVAAAPFDLVYFFSSPSINERGDSILVWLTYLKVIKTVRIFGVNKHMKRASEVSERSDRAF